MRTVLTAAFILVTATTAFAQSGGSGGGAGGEPPTIGDANAPRALRQGGAEPPKLLRRDDAMAPLVQPMFESRRVAGRPHEFGNNPTHTRNDPAGTRTQCRGGCQ
jgi:hypothetical protein